MGSFLSDSCQVGRLANAIVEKHFPGSGLASIATLTGGVFNASFLLTLSDGRRIVFQVAPKSGRLFSYERKLMRAAAWAVSLCEARGISVPHILAVDDGMTLIDRPYMLSAYIPGRSLHQIAVPLEEKYSCYQDAGSTVRQIHEITGPKFGRLAQLVDGAGFESWSAALRFEVQEWMKLAVPAVLLPERLFCEINAVFRAYSDLLDQIVTPHLVHGDLWSGNILASLEDGKCCFRAIIDLDHSLWGDPEFDFSGGMLKPGFSLGYGRRLAEYEEDADSFVRRKLYLLFYSMKQCYKYLCIHNDAKNSLKQRGYILQLLQELL